MVKVLHYVGVMKRAGLETFIMNMYRKLDLKKFQFGFLCTIDERGDYEEEILNLGGEIFHVSLNKTKGKLRHIKNYFILRQELKKLSVKYDVFHVHHYHAFDAYIAAKAAISAGFKKVIVHSHSDSTDNHFRLHAFFKHKLSRLNITKIGCSQQAANWMFDSSDFILKNGIDTQHFKFDLEIRNSMREKYGLKNEVVWGHVGRFDPVKNHDFLIKLFSYYYIQHPNSKLVLIGDGYEKQRIIEMCEKIGLRNSVIFAGIQNDVSPFYQMMDVYLMPSIYEGVSLTAVEAECSGLPCVFSSTISKEIDLRNNVLHCSLNKGFDVWIQAVNSLLIKDNPREKAYEDIIKKGYDVKSTCSQLMKIYER